MKIVVLSSHTKSLFWFRLDLMKAFIAAGHQVVAVGDEPELAWKAQFQAEGITYRQVELARTGTNPLHDLKTFRSFRKILAQEKPDKIFSYQAKSIIYGNLAAASLGITEVYSLIAGLGSIMRGTGLKNTVLKWVLMGEYKVSCWWARKLFFQNPDDRQAFLDAHLTTPEKTVIINGSGVNIEKFTPCSLPETPAFIYVGRLIRDKGIYEYLEACRLLKREHPQVRCLLVGPFDTNPSALKPEELEPYISDGIIEYFGEQADVRPFIAQASVLVLPSYHEGTPKSVLEAMAMGRAIVTSDAPGCRETVVDGENGYLVPVGNIDSLSEEMNRLVKNAVSIAQLGSRSRGIVGAKYDVNLVNNTLLRTMGIH